MQRNKAKFTITSLALLLSTSLSYADTVTMGNAAADKAAGGLTPATTMFNPAGLTLFDHPVVSASMIYGTDKLGFSGTATNHDPNLALVGQPPYSQTGSDYTRATGVLPGVFAVYPITPRIATGLAIYSPVDAQAEFDNDAIVRYEATLEKLVTIHVSPAMAIKMTPKWSLGLGLDADRMLYNESSQDINVLDNPGSPSTDYTVNNSGRSWAYGWHAGTMYQLTDKTRLGFAYKSKLTQHLQGNSKVLTSQGALAGESDAFKLKLSLPWEYRLGIYHDFNNRWSAMSEIHYVGWGVNHTLTAYNISDGGTAVVNRQDYPMLRNAWGFALAANYKVNEDWLLRAGAGIDQSPTRSSNNQQLSSPNNPTETVGLGAHYQITKMVGLDGGYTHVYMRNPSVTNYNPSTNIQLDGKLHNSINAVGLQLTWKFA